MFSSPHAQRLENWYGKETLNMLSNSMKGWYGDPIPVNGAFGKLYVDGHGDFVGETTMGLSGSTEDYLEDIARRELKRLHLRRVHARRQMGAITGYSNLLAAMGAGNVQMLYFAKTGTTGVANIASSLWLGTGQPAAGAIPAAPAAGTAYVNTTTGGLNQNNAITGNTQYFLGATVYPTVAGNCLLLADKAWATGHPLTTQSPAVTGVPTRYQNTTDSQNTFMSLTASNATTGTQTYQVTYTNQAGASSATTATALVARAVNQNCFANTFGAGWFVQLASGDTGLQKITQITQSATGTGTADLAICKPIAWLPTPSTSVPWREDASRSPLFFTKVFDSSCLFFLELNKPSTSATSYTGTIVLVQG